MTWYKGDMWSYLFGSNKKKTKAPKQEQIEITKENHVQQLNVAYNNYYDNKYKFRKADYDNLYRIIAVANKDIEENRQNSKFNKEIDGVKSDNIIYFILSIYTKTVTLTDDKNEAYRKNLLTFCQLALSLKMAQDDLIKLLLIRLLKSPSSTRLLEYNIRNILELFQTHLKYQWKDINTTKENLFNLIKESNEIEILNQSVRRNDSVDNIMRVITKVIQQEMGNAENSGDQSPKDGLKYKF
tara:strand:- start:177 stop:899 length:723 start_codon:yes stop_codon:yes gene_type:complete